MDDQATNAEYGSGQTEQPCVVKQFLASVSAARRQVNMYGDEHPNSQAATAEVIEKTRELASCYERATIILTRDAVIVNQDYYAASLDSMEMCERLRARGAMALTIVGAPPAEQVKSFLGFLNAEPREVRLQGGPSNYLRARGVSRIALTESVYSSGDGEDDAESRSTSEWNGASEDMVIAAVIDWLDKQDSEQDVSSLKMPISQILSNPDSAAKLIREAVTKLHVSRRGMTQGECVSEAIHDLRAISSDTPEEWDNATPRIRKALAKLPDDMRPATVAFALKSVQIDGDAADVQEVETMVHEILDNAASTQEDTSLPHPSVFERFFGATAPGLLSTWKRELQPTSVLESSGRTLKTLLTWETNACEHGRIVAAITALMARAVEISDTRAILLFSEWLVEDSSRDRELGWREANVRTALAQMDEDTLASAIEALATMQDFQAGRVASALLEMVPRVALHILGTPGSRQLPALRSILHSALVRLGREALPALSRTLREGSQSEKVMALGILAESRSSWAADEIANAIRQGDDSFILAALDVLPKMRVPVVTDICIGLLNHGDQSIRMATLAALSQSKSPAALHSVARIATRHGFFAKQATEERIAALRTLAAIGGTEAIDYLKSAATHRTFLGRSSQEPIRQEANRLLQSIQSEADSRHAVAA